jgi:hypothetical protein
MQRSIRQVVAAPSQRPPLASQVAREAIEQVPWLQQAPVPIPHGSSMQVLPAPPKSRPLVMQLNAF